jgi:pyruvate/2-oxoglutarate dehydrogenase complex dihydrolipoamide dehydrogenase (E3) component
VPPIGLPDGSSPSTPRANVIIGIRNARAAVEPIAGLAEARPLTHVEALELDEIPEHLLVIGVVGYVGLKLSQGDISIRLRKAGPGS